MKTIKKLTLKKETVASLESNEMGKLKGGTLPTDATYQICPPCATYNSCGCNDASGGGCVPGYSGSCGCGGTPIVATQNCQTLGCPSQATGYVCYL